jgi:mannose-6-phosphate isomerase-like protein (cupin superfamily)
MVPNEGTNEMKRLAYWFYGDLVTIHVSGEQTDTRFSLLEWLQPPGQQTPLHVHKRCDQTMYVLEGELALHGPGRKVVAGPGDVAHGPIGVPHTEHVTSAVPAKLVEVNSPAGFERFVAALGQPAPELALPDPPLTLPDPKELISVAAEHDIEVLGPPGSLP